MKKSILVLITGLILGCGSDNAKSTQNNTDTSSAEFIGQFIAIKNYSSSSYVTTTNAKITTEKADIKLPLYKDLFLIYYDNKYYLELNSVLYLVKDVVYEDYNKGKDSYFMQYTSGIWLQVPK